jgi:hypothetical protein
MVMNVSGYRLDLAGVVCRKVSALSFVTGGYVKEQAAFHHGRGPPNTVDSHWIHWVLLERVARAGWARPALSMSSTGTDRGMMRGAVKP